MGRREEGKQRLTPSPVVLPILNVNLDRVRELEKKWEESTVALKIGPTAGDKCETCSVTEWHGIKDGSRIPAAGSSEAES